jgi:long-chain acyl-CoA synthetase
MSDFPWLKEYQKDVPAEIDYGNWTSLLDIVDESIKKHADLPAFLHMGATLSYSELDQQATQLAAYFQSLGLVKGDRVAIMLPNCMQYPIAVLAGLKAGMAIVNVNPLYTARELEHQLNDSGAKAIVIIENFANVLQEVLAKSPVEHVLITALGDRLPGLKRHIVNFVVRKVKKMVPEFSLPSAVSLNSAISSGASMSFKPVSVGFDDAAFLQYTGGTTGVSKGAELTHKNMVSNVIQAREWLSPSGIEYTKERVITALPLYHIFALTANFLTFLHFGAQNLLITNPRDLPALVKDMKNFPYTVFAGVNTLFNGLLNTPGFSEVDFSDAKISLGGGMAVQRAVAEKWKEVTGVPLIEAYGLTETSPAACINPLNLPNFNGMVGLPISSTEVVIKDLEGKRVATGETGEICIKGPQVMKGYWNRPEETAKVIDDEGFFHTGDMGQLDEKGYVKVVDRLKDMIIVSGFNVYPNEIEDVLVTHPGVLEVGVIGVPDEKSGEAVRAIVVKKDDGLQGDELVSYAREQLTAYKVPKDIVFAAELPKTNVGKILRKDLRDQYR